MAKTIIDAIATNQKTFKNKIIYYPNTIIKFGKYYDYTVKYISEYDKDYLKWVFNKIPCHITDEVSLLINN